MNVLFIIDHLEIGGVQEFLVNYATCIPSHQVTVASLAFGGPVKDRLLQAGATVVELANKPHQGYLGKALAFTKSFFLLRDYLKSHRTSFDVIHIHLWRSFLYACLLRLYRYPNVTAALACDKRQLPLLVKWFYGVMARRFRYFFVHAPARHQFAFLRIPQERLLDQPYFVTPRNLELKAPLEGEVVLLSAGRLIPQKGHEAALLFTHTMREISHRDVRLVILGDGPDEQRLKALAADYRDWVVIQKATSNLDPFLARADAVIKFAVGEGVNSVVRECLHAGLLVASTLETDECRELAEKNFLIPLDRSNMQTSARALLAAISSRTPEDAARCSTFARLRWNNDAIRSFYESLDFA